jgi:hypothetical protein
MCVLPWNSLLSTFNKFLCKKLRNLGENAGHHIHFVCGFLNNAVNNCGNPNFKCPNDGYNVCLVLKVSFGHLRQLLEEKFEKLGWKLGCSTHFAYRFLNNAVNNCGNPKVGVSVDRSWSVLSTRVSNVALSLNLADWESLKGAHPRSKKSLRPNVWEPWPAGRCGNPEVVVSICSPGCQDHLDTSTVQLDQAVWPWRGKMSDQLLKLRKSKNGFTTCQLRRGRDAPKRLRIWPFLCLWKRNDPNFNLAIEKSDFYNLWTP